MDYQTIIVGAGPAGIFAALTLADEGVGPVLLLELGKDLGERKRRNSKDMLCGWGGAGAYSDGKLTLSPEVGGLLGEYLEPRSLHQILETADEIWVKHGAPEVVFGKASPKLENLGRLRQSLLDRVKTRTCSPVRSLLAEGGRIRGVRLESGETISSQFVVAAPGRSGAGWMKKEAESLGLKTQASPVDIGVRVELPAVVLKEITDIIYESKLIYYSKTFDEKVRTFCMNPYGEVVVEKTKEIVTVNGHSYARKKSENTNFAILVSSAFTEPFDDPIGYGFYIARLANLLGKGPIVQRLGDLLAGRRSTAERINRCLTRPTLPEATPGDLSFVFPFRHLQSIIEMLQALEKLAPGVYSRHTLLYGVEVKFYSNRIDLSPELETGIENLFAIGDGAGITRGLIQASASGILAARTIAKRLRNA